MAGKVGGKYVKQRIVFFLYIKTMDKGRIIFIDVIKCICIIWLVGLWHMSNYTSYEGVFAHYILNDYGSCLTKTSLHLFTFFTGFFTNVYFSTGNHNSVGFYIHKLKKTYILFALSAITLYFIPNPWDGGSWMSFSQLAFSLFGLGIIYPTPAPNTLWYMNMILFFYIIAPLLLSSSYLRSIGKVLTVFIMAAVILKLSGGAVFDGRFFWYFPTFILGLFCPTIILNRIWSIRTSTSKLGRWNILKLICHISESCIVVYLFHRQFVYVFHQWLGIPLMITAFLVFICSYLLYAQYNRFIKKTLGPSLR